MRRISAVAVLMVVVSALGGAAGVWAQEGSSGEDEKVVLRVGSSNDIDGSGTPIISTENCSIDFQCLEKTNNHLGLAHDGVFKLARFG